MGFSESFAADLPGGLADANQQEARKSALMKQCVESKHGAWA